MRRTRQPRQTVMSFKVTPDIRHAVEVMAAELTLERGIKFTMTDVIEEAIVFLRLHKSKPKRKRSD